MAGISFLALLPACALVPLLGTAALNAARVKKPTPDAPSHLPGSVSILIPARNEADRITPTLLSALQQELGEFEVIVLDDQSDDGTAEVVLNLARTFRTPVTVLPGGELPDGWRGKNWACQQLATAAKGDFLVFLDADVTLEPYAVRSAVHHLIDNKLGLVSCFPTQICQTIWEELSVPLMELFLYTCAPIPFLNRFQARSFAAANGQFMLTTREDYFTVGGHAAVCSEVVEDVALARLYKDKKLGIDVIAGGDAIRCRMYRTYQEVRDGFGKNVFAACGYSRNTLFGFVAAVLYIWLLPFLLLYFTSSALIAVILALVTRAIIGYRFSGNPWKKVLYHPISVLFGCYICLYSWYWYTYQQPTWKSRPL